MSRAEARSDAESIISEELQRADPEGLIALGAPQDEYAGEARRIAAGLSRLPSWLMLARRIERVLLHSFGHSPPQDSWPASWARALAARIWGRLHAPIATARWWLTADAAAIRSLGLKRWGALPQDAAVAAFLSDSAALAEASRRLADGGDLAFVFHIDTAEDQLHPRFRQLDRTSPAVLRMLDRAMLGQARIDAALVAAGAPSPAIVERILSASDGDMGSWKPAELSWPEFFASLPSWLARSAGDARPEVHCALTQAALHLPAVSEMTVRRV